MNDNEFLKLCKEIVRDYVNEHLDTATKRKITEDYVYCMWLWKRPENTRALLGAVTFDEMFFEITFDKNKSEMHLNAYKEIENKCIKIYQEDDL